MTRQLTSSDHRLIYQVIRHFDWAKLHRVMTFLDWKMLMPGGGLEIPTVFHLQQVAHRLLENAVKESKEDRPYTVGTGPFQVTCYRDEYDYRLSLSFVVDELSIDTEELDDWANNPTALEEQQNAPML